MRLGWALASVFLVSAACEPTAWRPPAEQDSHEDPAKIRPGFGNDALHAWWPLTAPEAAAIGGVDQARGGDAHALLALAILGSGDERDAASYARITRRFDDFVASERPEIEAAPDDRTRGELLNRAMHKAFFTGTPDPKYPDIGAYQLDQPRLTGVFDTGHYNCISSALLYTLLARAFSLPVRGVMTKTHAFVELDPAGSSPIDVETTTPDGFGKVHDAKFYADDAKWAKAHGLDPMTYDDYLQREIMPAYVFVARAMEDKRIVNDATQGRLGEASGALAPDDADAVYNRLVSYANEAKALRERKASRTTLRLVSVIAPVVADAATKFAGNPKIVQLVAWMAWFDASALEVVGRGDEAVSVASDALDHVGGSWPDAKELKDGFTGVLLDRMTELETAGQYEKSLDAVRKHIDACRSNEACLNNLYLTFDGWCVKYQLAKDWPNAKRVMNTCISLLPDDTRCHHTLSGLESLHPG
jgi:hypothetical protein